jgi:hypothetical protein
MAEGNTSNTAVTAAEVQSAVKKFSTIAIAVMASVAVWLLLGVVAFVTSRVCIGKSGSGGIKALGVLLAVLFGPFYFLLFLSPDYCRSVSGPRL